MDGWTRAMAREIGSRGKLGTSKLAIVEWRFGHVQKVIDLLISLSLSLSLSPATRITVNSVAPGFIDTA